MNVLGKTCGTVSHCLLQGFEIRVVILLRLVANQGYCSVYSAILLLCLPSLAMEKRWIHTFARSISVNEN